MADAQDDAALVRLALTLSAKPSHESPAVNPVTVTDTASGETRQLHDLDLSPYKWQQFQPEPSHLQSFPGSEAHIGSTDPRAVIKTQQYDLRQLPGMNALATAIGGPLPDKGEPMAQVNQLGMRVPKSMISQVDPVSVLGMPEMPLDMAPAARALRRDTMQFAPEVWYHATTHDFTSFDRSRANKNAFYGPQFYFTNHPYDAEINYMKHGPDLRRRIDERADEIENEIYDKEYEGAAPHFNSAERMDAIDRARQQANRELVGPHEGVMMPVHLKMQNPIRMTHDGTGTMLDFQPILDEHGEIVDDSPAFKRVAQAVEAAGKEYQFNAGKVLDRLLSDLPTDEPMPAHIFEDRIRDAFNHSGEFPTYRDTGGYAGGAAIARIYQEMGHDGIVMEPYRQFGMHGTNADTRHAIVFDPPQIRSVNAQFDPAKADSANILHVDPFGAGAALRLAQSHPKAASTAIGAATGAAIGSDADTKHPVRGGLAGAAIGAAAGHGIASAMERGTSLLDDRGRVGEQGWIPTAKADFKVTDLPRSARPSMVYKQIKEHDGYTVSPHTGVTIASGDKGPIMAGKYPNGDRRTAVIPLNQFSPDAVKKWFMANYDQFAKNNATKRDLYIGGWVSDGKVYLDISQGHEDVRKAVKTAEMQKHPGATRAEGILDPKGQKAVWNPQTGDVPVGNVHEFINSPEFKRRMEEMRAVGAETTPETSWWDLRGGPIEQTYGKENLPTVAGMIAATSPQQPVITNLRMATEYIRRLIKGEPVVQPYFRAPKGSYGIKPGKGIPLAGTAAQRQNVTRVAEGRAYEVGADKVNDMFRALMGDVNASVYDRHWAKLAEDPSSGVFMDREPNKVTGSMRSGKRSPYADLENVVRDAAKEAGMTPAQYSAQVWEGIRETIRKAGQLYGQLHDAGAIPKTTEGFNETFERLVKEKADWVGISVQEFKDRLAKGDATLLSMMLGTTVGAMAFGEWKSQQQK